MNRIFISYKRVDKDKVFRIKNLIESHIGKDECWIDLDGIESDAQFMNVIINAINNCEVVLFMYSKAHTGIRDFEKDWTVRELDFASAKNKRIVFVNIDGTPLTDQFSFYFGLKQQVDGQSAESLERLIRDLHKWLNVTHPKPVQSRKQTSYETLNNVPKEDPKELYEKGLEYYQANDYTTAVKYYRNAAERGHAAAQFNLGSMYEEGQGVEQDYFEAVKWYRKAAEQGLADAQNSLGWMYQFGCGVEQDSIVAQKWFDLAKQQRQGTKQEGWLKRFFKYGD